MSTETLSQELQQAFEVYKAKYPDAEIGVDDDGVITVYAYGRAWETKYYSDAFIPPRGVDERFRSKTKYDFKNQEAAIPFLMGKQIPFRVNREIKWLQMDYCTVLAHSKDEAGELANTSTDWIIEYALQPEETDFPHSVWTEGDAEREDSGCKFPKYDNLLLLRDRTETVGINLNQFTVLNGDAYIYDETRLEANSSTALVRVPTEAGAAALFRDIDSILERHQQGDATAKGDLQLLSAAL